MSIELSVATTAAVVDRVVLGVHRSISDEDKQRIRAILAGVDLKSPGYWVDLADFMAAGTLTDDLVKTRFRYAQEAAIASIDELRERRLVDDELRPTAALIEIVDVVNDVRLANAAELWGDEADLGLLANGADAMLKGAAGPLVGPYRGLTEPTGPVALLWHRLIGLRYLRADAHAAAWETAGLNAAEMVTLTNTESKDLSDQARALCDAIEDDTNGRSEPAYRQLDHWSEWMVALAGLRSRATEG
ncbi:MAG: hypothetical protein GY926_10610 [bacterium]|nr:hypothetical protein [bacterium]